MDIHVQYSAYSILFSETILCVDPAYTRCMSGSRMSRVLFHCIPSTTTTSEFRLVSTIYLNNQVLLVYVCHIALMSSTTGELPLQFKHGN